LKRDQIIAIHINEDKVKDGNNVIALLYYKESVVPEATPFSGFTYKNYGAAHDWESHKAVLAADLESRDKDIVSI
jgi:hypothetical protein